MPTISALPAAASVGSTDLFAIVQGATTKKATEAQVLTNIQANIQITESQVTNLTTDLAGCLKTANNLSELTGTAATARTNLGLGSAAVLNSPIPMANGGTGTVLTADNGAIVYSNGTTMALLAHTATANQLLLSGNNAAPSFSTSTYPATNAINTLLYASSANTMAALPTGNSGTLITSAGGIPSISSTLPSTVQGNITTLGAQAAALNMNTHLINGVVDPVSPQDAATKNYVDQTALNGTSVYAASAATLGTVTQSGAGVGATLTNAGVQATFALDGASPPVGVNVLIKNTAAGMTSANEGIYTVTSVGSGASNWVLTRATSYDTATEINNTGIIAVQNGSTLAGTGWYNTATIAIVDTTAFSYAQFGASSFSQVLETLVTTTQAFTPNASTKYIQYNIVSGGGGSGGASASATGASAGEGGSGGGSSQGIVTRATWIGAGTAATITIGAAGAAGSAGANNGGTGGTSSIIANSGAGATLAQATGGAGGQGDSNHAANFNNVSNPAPGAGSSGTLNLSGGYGQGGLSLTTAANGGFGGNAAGGWGQGGPTNNNGAGTVGTGYGAGAGAAAATTNTDRAGAAGTAGACLVIQYI